MLALTVLMAGVWGCDPGPRPPGRADAGPDGTIVPPPTGCSPGGPSVICSGNESVACNADGTEGARTNCVTTGQVCADGIGCVMCRPNSFQCSGNNVERCSSDGSAWMPHATCDGAMGQMCNPSIGACTSLCDDAAASNSYIGCEYWPVTTLNSQVDAAFTPAVVIANPQSMPATVTVTRGGTSVGTATVAPGAIETITLPWVTELKQDFDPDVPETSGLVRGGAYRVVSNVPVTVYQFNPLEYEQGGEFSFSNDASLLLPTHVMTGNYMVLSRPAMLLEIEGFLGGAQQSASPGFFTVVGVSSTPVNVNIQFRGRVRASTDGSVRAFTDGETGMFTLNQGDVLQIVSSAPSTCSRLSGSEGSDDRGLDTVYYCQVGPEFDLTGTEIRADGPVEVISGHNCAFMPFNRWACDHLEEAIFPLESWGTESIVSKTQPPMGRTEPNIVRVISGHDNNMITFDPPSAAAATTLNRGQFIEFEASQSVQVRGTEALLVGQFLVGQDYGGLGSAGEEGEGDPAMSLGIPSEQFRSEYTFLAPGSYPTSFVNVTAPGGSSITLDGSPVALTQPVGGSGFSVGQVPISAGQHTISGDQPFGIVVYGYGSYTSYMYPGGLDFEEINIPF